MVDRIWMPFFIPRMTETLATSVMTTMVQVCSVTPVSMPELRRLPNWVIASTPRPSEVHTPKVVHAMAMASMQSPRGEKMRLPRSG